MKSYDDLLIRHAKQPVHAVEKGYRPLWEGEGSIEEGSIEGEPTGAKGLFGRIEHRNRSCGDVVRLWWMSENGVLTHIRHHATGCMLCKASASILCEVVEGRPLEELPMLIETAMRLTCDAGGGGVGAPGETVSGNSGATEHDTREHDRPEHTDPSGQNVTTGHTSTPEAMLALSQVREFPTRRKCITLAWEALASTLAAPSD